MIPMSVCEAAIPVMLVVLIVLLLKYEGVI